MINTLHVLIRLGIAKKDLRKWLQHGCIFKKPSGVRLQLKDEFNNVSVQIRSCFILAAPENNIIRLNAILNTELGIADRDLPVLLSTKTPLEIVNEIVNKNPGLPYTMRKFEHF